MTARAEVDMQQIARGLRDANRKLREYRIEQNVLIVAVGAMAALAFALWVAVLVDLGVVVVANISSAFFASRWMRRQGLERVP